MSPNAIGGCQTAARNGLTSELGNGSSAMQNRDAICTRTRWVKRRHYYERERTPSIYSGSWSS
jgi:hypothetical protein